MKIYLHTPRITRGQFRFGTGRFSCPTVIYSTPVRGDYWVLTLNDGRLKDMANDILLDDCPTQAALKRLRSFVIDHGTHYNKHGEKIYKYY